LTISRKTLFRWHRYRERDPSIIMMKKKEVWDKFQRLECEVCAFDFEKVYGERGKQFAECHHSTPVSKLNVGQRTKLEDLRIVCSNCHRMLHRNPLTTVEKLREQICV